MRHLDPLRRSLLSFAAMPEPDPNSDAHGESPLSLNRLRQAFAAMLGEKTAEVASDAPGRVSGKLSGGAFQETGQRGIEISPRSVVEAILFVGRPDNASLSARELAAAMRGVSPGEIDAAISQLNMQYDADGTPYCIEKTSTGYRLMLRDSFVRLREKFYGRARQVKLSPAAMDVLAVVAYKQPVTAYEVNQLRGATSGGILSTLVRRKLIRLARADGSGPCYETTDRFLKLFGLESLGALPRSEELEKV